MNISNDSQHLQMLQLRFSEKVFIIIFALLGIALNLLVCIILGLKRHSHPPLDRLILNLAIADLLNCCTIASCHILEFLLFARKNDYPPISDQARQVICKLWILGISTTATSSIQTLAAISIERWKAIIHPFSHPITQKQLKIFILFNWLLSSGAALFMAFLHTSDNEGSFSCNEISDTNLLIATSFFYGITNFILFVIVSVCYVWIGVALYKSNPPTASPNCQHSKIVRKNCRKAIALLCITVLSIVSSTQFSILYLYLSIVKHIVKSFTLLFQNTFLNFYRVTWLLALISSSVNPILYNYCSENFHAEFIKLFCKRQLIGKN